jgi:heptosyltransferase III
VIDWKGSAPRRILVIKLRHLGDVLLTTPVFQALREKFPHAEIVACVNSGTEQVLEGNPDISGILTVPSKTSAATLIGRSLKQFKFLNQVRCRDFDMVLDFTVSDRSAVLTRISGAKTRIGFVRFKGFLGKRRLYTATAMRKRGVHVVEQQLELLRGFGIESGSPRLRYAVRPEARTRVRQLLSGAGEIVHVHPVSRLLVKCWPAPFMAELLDHIAARGLTPVITASDNPREKEWVADLVSRMRTRSIDLSGALTLEELGALSERSRCFIGVDSAPMHIAAAVGAPVIGIFGPSSEILWGPWCEKKLVLAREMDCRLPCKLKNTCPHIACLREMTPEMVIPRVDQFLASILPRESGKKE